MSSSARSAQELADAIGSPALNRSLVVTCLAQLRPAHVVELNDRRWILSERPRIGRGSDSPRPGPWS